MALIWRTNNALIATAAGTTFTHGLGATPDMVYITSRSNTGVPFLSSSNSQIVVVGTSVANQAADIEVVAHHSIVQ